ncbi:MAG: hypothetical protein CFE33_12770 [Pseudorhodobacter sp. PARRP1]|nr:MAG: hypothetical protein CFE33_12770 [Pseudorhodobacter sp. PARRP1]
MAGLLQSECAGYARFERVGEGQAAMRRKHRDLRNINGLSGRIVVCGRIFCKHACNFARAAHVGIKATFWRDL